MPWRQVEAMNERVQFVAMRFPPRVIATELRRVRRIQKAMYRSTPFELLVLASALSCSVGPGTRSAAPSLAGDSLVVRTTDTVYRAAVEPSAVWLTLVAILSNGTHDTLWVHPCLQSAPFPPLITLQRLEGDAWRTVWGPFCTRALIMQPPRVLPGQSRVDTLRIWGSFDARTFPQFPPPVPGVYRLVYGDVFRRWYPTQPPPGARNPLGVAVDSTRLISNPFRILED